MKALIFSLVVLTAGVAQAQTIDLPNPDTAGGVPLMQALAERQSMREFSKKKLSEQELSDLLWAAFGFNRPDKRTIPTSMNKQNMSDYVLKDDGAWLYEAKENRLKAVSKEDLRPLLGAQKFAVEAPLTLLFVAENNAVSGMHVGSAYQNVGLYCASTGLNNVVRRLVDFKALAKALGLKNEEVLATQSVGYPL